MGHNKCLFWPHIYFSGFTLHTWKQCRNFGPLLQHCQFTHKSNKHMIIRISMSEFRKVFEVEPYVLSFMSREHRSYLAQLRNDILPLQLELGRWINKAIEEGLCLICNNSTVEDEERFLFIIIWRTIFRTLIIYQ